MASEILDRPKIAHRPKKKNMIKKADGFRIQPYRRLIQWAFLLITLWVGIEFYLFVRQLESGTPPTISRPPGVEAFLPISALISLKYWLLTGVFNLVHPSSLVLLLIILATAFFLKKGFCSWVCPFGLLSEYLARIHKILFDRIRNIPRWLDYPLRSLKYLLLLFFLWTIIFQMNVFGLQAFIASPYNKVADIKMLKFFTDMTSTTFWVLILLVLFSILIPYFWCRYLCPYGALLGFVSMFSPFKIHRNLNYCIDCDKCTKACPARIKVHKAKTVVSDECHACLQCVDACPVRNTLYLSVTKKRWQLPRVVYALMLVGLFLIGTTVARLTGYWQNNISNDEYRYHIQFLNDPAYQHNRGSVPNTNSNKFQQSKDSDKN